MKKQGIVLGFRVGTNITSLSAQRTLGQINRNDAKTSEQLSSSDRIVRAAYDPAGLAISEGQKAHIRSLGQARKNANDAISFFQVAESALGEGHNIAMRMRELAMQSANGTIGDENRAIINQEFQSLKDQMESIANSTSYNNINLLNGKNSRLDLHVGLYDKKDRDYLGFKGNKVNVTLDGLGMGSVDVKTAGTSRLALGKIDTMIQRISSGRAELGSLLGRMNHVTANIDYFNENTNASKSRIRDTDIAKAAAEKTSNNIRLNATTSLLNTANNRANSVLSLIS